MSLFGSIQMGGNTLQAMQIGLHVVGNNIANANTPGYVRQEAVFVPGPVQRLGHLILGTGVLVDSIVDKLDRFVQDRLTGARGDRASADVQEQIYREIEGILNEFSEAGVDLSSALTNFFNAVHEVMTEPGNVGARNQVVAQGIALTENIVNLHDRVFDIQQQLNDRVTVVADEINSLAEEIRLLNIKIASSEGGDTSVSDAGALRVKRQNAVDYLAELIGVRVVEQPSGGLAVSVDGELLVFEGQRREVTIDNSDDTGVAIGVIQFADTNSPLNVVSGELSGLYTARNQITGGFLEKLDQFAATLAFEFNKVYSQGQGLVGFKQLTSTELVDDANAPLDEAGLRFTPVSGAFNVLIHSKADDLTTTHTIHIDLDGIDEDTTLNDLAAQLNAIDGLTASVSANGALVLARESTDIEFGFGPVSASSTTDTSGVLAALGLNTFFTGFSSATLGVNDELKGVENAGKFAASLGGFGQYENSENAKLLAGFLDRPIESAGNATVLDLYNQTLIEVAQGSAIAGSIAEGFRVFEATLEGQKQAVSGVSIDEEAIQMITLQRIYQASARYIQTISELLDTLVNL
jgi:flagellar hook-associated protein 1 FlgK